jgi:predicted GIY-YIG superfamily endonuclease
MISVSCPTVYLVHLDVPLGEPQTAAAREERHLPPRKTDKPHRAQHYIGWTLCLSQRMQEHRTGRGSRMLAAATAAGIAFRVARQWPGGDRSLERRLKNYKNARDLCPICNPGAWNRMP